jgi:hypothetical protein
MNSIKKQKIEDLYYDWSSKQSNMSNDELKSWSKLRDSVSGLSLETSDKINEYGATMERLGFLAGFDTAIKLLIGGEANA